MNSEIILVTVRGKDEPGITSKLTQVLAESTGVSVADIEQTIIHGRLLLSILLKFEKGSETRSSVLKDLLFVSKELHVNIDFEVFNDEIHANIDMPEYVITCLGSEIGAKEISAISTELARHGVNINKIARLSHENLSCLEMIAQSTKKHDAKELSKGLLPLSKKISVDIAIQQYDLLRQAKRLVLFDMDSTLIKQEVINQIAEKGDFSNDVKKITEDVVNGKTSYRKGFLQRVKLLKGVNAKILDEVYANLELNEGADNLIKILKRLGYKTGIISGGFSFFTNKLKERLNLDYAFSNELEIIDGKLSGKISGTIVDDEQKARLLEHIAEKENIDLDQVVAIGDGANDILMLSKAGLGIAFQARVKVIENAGYSITRHSGLNSMLYLLGISEKEIIKLNRKGV